MLEPTDSLPVPSVDTGRNHWKVGYVLWWYVHSDNENEVEVDMMTMVMMVVASVMAMIKEFHDLLATTMSPQGNSFVKHLFTFLLSFLEGAPIKPIYLRQPKQISSLSVKHSQSYWLCFWINICFREKQNQPWRSTKCGRGAEWRNVQKKRTNNKMQNSICRITLLDTCESFLWENLWRMGSLWWWWCWLWTSSVGAS